MTATAKPRDINREAAEHWHKRFGGEFLDKDGEFFVLGYTTTLGNILSVGFKDGKNIRAETPAHLLAHSANDNVPPSDEDDSKPIDPWAQQEHPALPKGLLPPLIEEFALAQADIMGVDAGGIAAAALAVCGATISDNIKIRVKKFDDAWHESARIWIALIGNPSAKKSPILSVTTAPLKTIDFDLVREYNEARAEYDNLSAAEKKSVPPPRHKRLRLEDTTIEAAQEILKDSPDGVLCVADELSGWFGSMDKYSNGKGAAKDRAFWLQSYNGGSYSVDRVGRGSTLIDNLSVSMLGGIQPEPIRKLAEEAVDDGLLQRLFPIVLGKAGAGQDVETPPTVVRYRALVHHLHKMPPPKIGLCETFLRFDEDAQAFRNKLSEKHHALQTSWEEVNKKVGAHIGKYDGLFARLCVIWHCIETDGARPSAVVDLPTAERVAAFLHGFLFPHARAFYGNILGITDQHDAVLATAGYILAHHLEQIDVRTIKRGDRVMRSLRDWEAEEVLSKLDAFGWLEPSPLVRNQTAPKWTVRPIVHTVFADHAKAEAKRRSDIRKIITQSMAA